jgi:NitT/TauT family transport system substrate-binding protein
MGTVMLAVGAGAVQAETKILQGYVSPGALQWPEYIANEFGWCKENGVSVELIIARGAVGGAQQLAAGSLNLAYSGFPDFMRATDQGAPQKIVINSIAAPPYSVYAKPAIKSAKDLKGKVVAIGGTKDVTLIYIEAMIKPAGLAKNDLNFVYAKSTQDRFAALMSGGADAAILYPPSSFIAGKNGYTDLGNIETYLKDFPFTVMAVDTRWAAKNREALIGFTKAYGRAVKWLHDTSNKDEAVQLLVKYAKQKADDAAATYDYFIKDIKAFSTDGLISDAAFKKMTDALVEFGDIKRPVPPKSRFIDDSYVKAGWP